MKKSYVVTIIASIIMVVILIGGVFSELNDENTLNKELKGQLKIGDFSC